MNKRTKALQIPMKVKDAVYKRDQGRCIFCHKRGDPVGHFIGRSQGGCGIEQNIITVCFICHQKLDNTVSREEMKEKARRYLKSKYKDWNEEELYYKKWNF